MFIYWGNYTSIFTNIYSSTEALGIYLPTSKHNLGTVNSLSRQQISHYLGYLAFIMLRTGRKDKRISSVVPYNVGSKFFFFFLLGSETDICWQKVGMYKLINLLTFFMNIDGSTTEILYGTPGINDIGIY